MMTSRQKTLRQGILVHAHQDFEKGLLSYAFFKIHDRTLSDDLVQDTFLKTWKYLVQGGKIDLMRAFLYHTLNNLIIDQYRKRKTSSLDAMLESETGFEPSVDDSERLFNFLDGERALLLIKRLPLIYQKVMHMKYIQSLSLKEMSLVTGQSRSTVATRVYRGLEKMKALHLQWE